MDGLVVCAMAGARRGRGFEPRFVCPSRGPLARPPPPPPSASRSTTGTAGASGGVSPPFFPPLALPLTPDTRKTRHQARHTCSSALRHCYRRPPGGACPPRTPPPLARGRGIELGSSGLHPAARPLQHAAGKPPVGPAHPDPALGRPSACLIS